MQPEEQGEKEMKRNEQNLREMLDTIKCINICKMGVPEGEDREEQKKY